MININGENFATIEEVERSLIVIRLNIFDNNRSKAAKSLDISRTTFYRKMEKYNIRRIKCNKYINK